MGVINQQTSLGGAHCKKIRGPSGGPKKSGGTMLVVCISLSIWLLILWLWNGTDENELWPAPVPSHSQDGCC